MSYVPLSNHKLLFVDLIVFVQNSRNSFIGFWPIGPLIVKYTFALKDFFIVKLPFPEARHCVLQEGLWFWGTTGLFITPWFLAFDANTMVISRMPVWILLHNLPLHFWDEHILSDIGNSIGKFLKMDTQLMGERIYTHARICVDVHLSKGLSNHIQLLHKQMNWTQTLAYENTAFKCRICRETGHLQNICLEAKKDIVRRKKNGEYTKGWNFHPFQQEVGEDGAEEDFLHLGTNQTP